MYTSCPIPPHFDGLLLPSDHADSVDLSSILFRMHRSVGGAWTEYIKSDLILRQLATTHHASLLLASVRICPFCRLHHGTPRHYVMECPETVLYSDKICDAVESTLAGLGFPMELRDAGFEHYAKFPSPYLFDFPPSSVRRWPILSSRLGNGLSATLRVKTYSELLWMATLPPFRKGRLTWHIELSSRLHWVTLSIE